MMLEKDSSPSMQLHNNCNFPVHFGQMLADDNFPGQLMCNTLSQMGRRKRLNICDWIDRMYCYNHHHGRSVMYCYIHHGRSVMYFYSHHWRNVMYFVKQFSGLLSWQLTVK